MFAACLGLPTGPPLGPSAITEPKQMHSLEMPNPSIPALENVVRSHSAQLTKLNSELSSAFSQVTGEMGELRTSAGSASSSLSALTTQVAALTDMVARLHKPAAAEVPPVLPPVCPAVPAPTIPQVVSADPRCEPGLITPLIFSGEFDKCLGFLGQCRLMFLHQPSRFPSGDTRIALIVSALSDRALDWVVAALESNYFCLNLKILLTTLHAGLMQPSGCTV